MCASSCVYSRIRTHCRRWSSLQRRLSWSHQPQFVEFLLLLARKCDSFRFTKTKASLINTRVWQKKIIIINEMMPEPAEFRCKTEKQNSELLPFFFFKRTCILYIGEHSTTNDWLSKEEKSKKTHCSRLNMLIYSLDNIIGMAWVVSSVCIGDIIEWAAKIAKIHVMGQWLMEFSLCNAMIRCSRSLSYRFARVLKGSGPM